MTTLISRYELRAAIDDGTVTVVDALGESYYAQMHLPGALNLVEDDVDARAAELAGPGCCDRRLLLQPGLREQPGGGESAHCAGLQQRAEVPGGDPGLGRGRAAGRERRARRTVSLATSGRPRP